jgi:hypothetical protein
MSRDDVAIVQEALMACGWGHVAPALGMRYRQNERILCPIHNGKDENFSFSSKGKLTWKCWSTCGSGDVIELIQKLRNVDFREALHDAADIAGVVLEDSGSPEDRERRAQERTKYLESARKRAQIPERERPYPPQDEVELLWSRTVSITEDHEASEYLAGRGIDPMQVASRPDLLRVIPSAAQLPRWARYRGKLPEPRSWSESGHRLLMRSWDATGELRSVRAWRIRDDEHSPKRLPPAGYRASGLVLANSSALLLLRGEWGQCRVVVVEGEPDHAVWSSRTSEPVIGVLSGSWTKELADRIPYGSEVVIRTHCDVAGDKYAKEVADSLRGRCHLLRLTNDTKRQENQHR